MFNPEWTIAWRCRGVANALALGFVVSLTLPARAQEVTVNKIAVNEDRPLAYAAQSLADQTKTFITFEELPFENGDDLVQTSWRDRTYFIAKYGEFTFEYDASTPIKDVLDALLKKYQAEYPGTYKVLEGENVFHIVPDSSRDLSGAVVSRRSLLDARVSLNLSNVTGEDLVCEIVKQVAVATEQKLFCITDRVGLRRKTFEEYNVSNEPARDVLADVLRESGDNVSWFLWRDIDANMYTITFIGQPHSSPATNQ